MYEEINKERESNNKRLRSIEFLKLNILLYNERNFNESKIKNTFKNDL